MDWALSDEQEELQGLARRILGDRMTHERLKQLEAGDAWYDLDTWQELAAANLLGLPLPDDVGGSGYSIFELCLLLEEVGRAVAPVPMFPTLVLGALPIAEFGTDEQRSRFLPEVVRGGTLLTAALTESLNPDAARPATTAAEQGGAWRLDGQKICVPAADLAATVLVPAATGETTVGVFLVDPHADGVELERLRTTSGEPQFRLGLSGAVGEPLGDPRDGGSVVQWIVDRAVAGLCAMQVGVADRALRLTAEYTTSRRQFDKPLASFQAVAQRAADAYIDVEGIRLTAYQAAWRLAESLPAANELAVAKYWAAEGGQRVVHAAQHLHGGVGVDVDYPLHRSFTWTKQIELTLGSATPQLARLGAALAREPVS